MKNIEKFTKGEMSEEQERRYLESLYGKHYDEKLKSTYGDKLKVDYNVHRSLTEKPSGRKSTLKYIIIGASSIAAILVFVLYALPLFQNGDEFNAQTYAQNIITIEKIDVKRGQQEKSQLKLDIIEAYNSGKYEEALSMYSQVNDLSSEDKYFKGRLLLYQNKYQEAIETFQQVDSSKTFKYNIELKYWLAVAYSASGKNDLAKPLLKEVAETSWKSIEVNNLLKKMK